MNVVWSGGGPMVDRRDRQLTDFWTVVELVGAAVLFGAFAYVVLAWLGLLAW